MAQPETENLKTITTGSGTYFLWALTLFLVLLISISLLSAWIISDKNIYYPYRLLSTLELVRLLYPDEYDGQAMIKRAREAVFARLDRYSGYVEPEMLKRVTEEFSGAYSGIGITVVNHNLGLQIMTVRADGPAGRGGMVGGDIIMRADTVSLAGMSTHRASFLLRGEENTKVDLTVLKPGSGDTLIFSLIRQKLKLVHIPYAGLTETGILYIRLIDFETGVAEQLRDVLDSLFLNKDNRPKAVILDLKGNPGGLLNQAVKVTNMFLDEDQLIVGIKGRSRWNERQYFSSGKDLINGLPLAILVNRGSASASEIVAGALKFSGRALLVGDTTFGKGLVQEYNYLYDGSGIRLTTARYYFEGEIYLNDPNATDLDSSVGIAPDYYFQSVSAKAFPKFLERSTILREFALDNKESILRYEPFEQPAEVWFDDFISFAEKKNISYTSEFTNWARFVRNEVIFANYSDSMFGAIDSICSLSEVDDSQQFKKYSDYIRRRIYQIALEVEYGSAKSYREAVVPYRSDIIFTEKILRGEHIN